MKRLGILNAQLAQVIAAIGHGQTILIADAGMPRPPQVPIVDLALVLGIPRFIDVVRAVVEECAVETFTIAAEFVASDHAVLTELLAAMHGTTQATVSHKALKKLSKDAVLFVRTGEATPYANVLLSAGVVF